MAWEITNSIHSEAHKLVADAKGSIFRTSDGKYFLYLPKGLVEDTEFPFKFDSHAPAKIVIDGQKLLVIPIIPQKQSAKE
jgi:hypothetical protein